MPKIAIIGAGSMVFAKNIVGDVLSFPDLSDSTISLMDIDKDRLERTANVADAMVDNAGLDATVEATTDRREAIRDADYVLNMINVGGTDPFEPEIRIPESYGIEQAIGDTLGPGGIFRGLRTIPVMLDLAADERYDGFLCWSFTSWPADVYADPTFQYVQGDEYLVYPGRDGPISSIRWELLREGIEDYELVRAAGTGAFAGTDDRLREAIETATAELDGRRADVTDLPRARRAVVDVLTEFE